MRHSLSYDAYLRSSLWRLRRWWWFVQSTRRCERCHIDLCLHRRDERPPFVRVLTVHHLNYDRLWRERRSDVRLLCWPCHRSLDWWRHRNPSLYRQEAQR